MNTGRLMQDQSSHWYFVPLDLLAEFDRLDDLIGDGDDVDLCGEFDNLFTKYRLSMHPSQYTFSTEQDL